MFFLNADTESDGRGRRIEIQLLEKLMGYKRGIQMGI
jgi:hypothetical protein